MVIYLLNFKLFRLFIKYCGCLVVINILMFLLWSVFNVFWVEVGILCVLKEISVLLILKKIVLIICLFIEYYCYIFLFCKDEN